MGYVWSRPPARQSAISRSAQPPDASAVPAQASVARPTTMAKSRRKCPWPSWKRNPVNNEGNKRKSKEVVKNQLAGGGPRQAQNVSPLNPAYFRRIEAMEFAVKYDDGVGAGLDEADIILVGVSRTSKTPLSIYLGYLGHKVANVPIVKGISPPKELFELDPAKIVGLTINADRLAEIRRARVRNLGANNRRYSELGEVYEELEEATAVQRRLGCPVIDISELSIEETAQQILRTVESRRADAAAARTT